MKRVIAGFIRGWRKFISPLYGDVCKFYPTCSEYGLEAVELHGAWKGSALAVARILRCHPWSAGGYDPVPGSERAARMADDAPWAMPRVCQCTSGETL